VEARRSPKQLRAGGCIRIPRFAFGNFGAVSRPTRFENNRYVGDKRTQVVYDLDLVDADPAVTAAVEELLASERFAAFGPDTLAEARNRGYRPHRSIRNAAAGTET
jgi:hypothetical protein